MSSASSPMLLNPGRLSMPFSSFLEACDWKQQGGGSTSRTVRVVNELYDNEDDSDPPPGASLDVPLAVLAKLSLYCVEDVREWPQDLFEIFAPHDPAQDLLPEWVPLLQERRVWMSAGGPEGVAHVSAGFHWDHMQNIHVLLSGQKEVFLLPPLEAPALYATRFCRQAQWVLDPGATEGAAPRVVLEPMRSEETSSDYAVVAVDHEFDTNVARNPALRELREAPRWSVLMPGDAMYIPVGWWHSIRTRRPPREEHGVPFSLSVNFWYNLTPAASMACRSEILTLQVLSCQRALAGDPQQHLDDFLQKLGANGVDLNLSEELWTKLQARGSKDASRRHDVGDAEGLEFSAVD